MARVLLCFVLLGLPLCLLAGEQLDTTQPSSPHFRPESRATKERFRRQDYRHQHWNAYSLAPQAPRRSASTESVKYTPESAAARNDGNTRVSLAPGEKVTVSHDLDPQTRQVTLTKATVAHENPTANVSGDFVAAPNHAKVAFRHPLAPRELLARCTIAHINVVQATVPITVNYINAAQQFMRNTGGQGHLYSKWFRTYDLASESIIATTFEHMSDNQFNTFTYNCGASAPDCIDPDDVAYVEPEVMPLAGYNSRASTLVHEASYFAYNGASDTIAYGVQESLTLALRNAGGPVSNACNYEYFSVDAFNGSPQAYSGDELPAQEVLG
ncbi:hypothetical protein LXA43DRAFT_1057093 [Ganoderma leucocontextum]|nr:hypothetical protein LXA43DRAFT_1057093 [Ganoderma leucocontextum]